MAEKNIWKTIGITFIVLFVLGIIIFIWLLAVGSKSINNETECSINICGNVEGAVSYQYDDYEKICYCLDSEGEIVKQQFIK